MVDQEKAPTGTGEEQGSRERFLPYFLRRLEGLERLKHGGSAPDPLMAKMLDKAIFSTWLDCVSLGGKDEAEAIIRPHASGGEQPRELSGSSSTK